MAYFRYPDYYTKFVCLGSDCRDTCCQHWEIDIDDKTLEYWQNVGGELGEKLMANITEDEDGRYIKLDSHEMCPFLTENKLCSLYTRLGESHISNICREHPRWYNWYSQGREAGMGICCEAVAKLVISDANEMTFSQYETDEITDDDYSDEDIEAEKYLFNRRELLLSKIRNCNPENIDSLINDLCSDSYSIQHEYENLFIYEDDADYDVFMCDFVKQFFTKENVLRLTDEFLSYEINDKRWEKILTSLKENTDEILARRNEYMRAFGNGKKEYLRLLHYFIYRYFTQAFDDDRIHEKVNFALISVCYIQLINILLYIKTGLPDIDTRCDICKFYSSEIEYSTENQKKASEFYVV